MHVDCFVIVKFKEENPISTVQPHSVVLGSQSEADQAALNASITQVGDDTCAALPASLSFGITKLQAESERSEDDYLAIEGA